MKGEFNMKKVYEFIEIGMVRYDQTDVLGASNTAPDNYIGDDWDETLVNN